MAKDPAGSSSWWGMPRVISSLWTSPEEEAAGESEKENMEELVEKRRRSIRERDVTPFDRKEATENRVVRSHSSKSRSRSRSSSGSVKVSKAEAQVPSKNDENISVEISNISFSFFNEENKQDLALLNNHSTDKPESPVPVVEALQVDKLEKDPDESDDLSFSSTFSSPYDKVQKKQQEPTVQDPHTVEYSVPKRSPSPIYSSISKVTPGRGKRESAETGTPRTGLDPEHDQQLGDPDRLRPRQSGRTQLRGHRPEGVHPAPGHCQDEHAAPVPCSATGGRGRRWRCAPRWTASGATCASGGSTSGPRCTRRSGNTGSRRKSRSPAPKSRSSRGPKWRASPTRRASTLSPRTRRISSTWTPT
ncbi:uncharacterized protein [Bemisia tabaci]|uniref:uncharacterized protein n=1 Tax=Bemisia tabaci TaxID=7038 RepID=UPI003B28769C